MKKKKTIIAAAILLLVLLIGGAIAYFTDTDNATNVFTIGNIDIILNEDNWDADAAQNVMPGDVIAKDPTIKNNSAANGAYVFMKVEAPCSTDTQAIELFTLNGVSDDWYLMIPGTCTSGKITKVYAYGTSSAMEELAAGATTQALFSGVTVNTAIDKDTTLPDSLNVNVYAYGIQAQGLASSAPSAVWSDGQFS